MPTTKITVYRNGRPAQNVKVTLEYSGFTQMGFTNPAYTDSNGVALVNHSSTGQATLWVDKVARHKMNTPGQDIIYL